MIYKSVSSEAELELEQWMDKRGLAAVMHSLADIAGQKADHVLHNWQDAKLAKVWNDAAIKLEATANTFDSHPSFTQERKQ